MDDAEYIFRTDAKEKKITARSARKKVTHSGCKLPSDYLTAKQKKQLNGEVMTVNMNKPVAFKAFKLWPKDIQEEYLNGLIKTYGVGRKQIASMMGVTAQTLYRFTCDNSLDVHFSGNGKYPNYDPDKWEKFCNGELEEELGQAIDYSKNPDGEIVTYCENDVRSTQELHRAFRGADVVTMSVSLRDVRSLEDIVRYLQIVNWPEKNEVTICIVESEVNNA